jgi:hypothetical protein
LGDRLGTLACAIRYALKTGRVLFVDWGDGIFGSKGDNVFYKYFQLKSIPHVTSMDDMHSHGTTYYPPAWGDHLSDSIYDVYWRVRTPLDKIVPHLLKGKGNVSKLFHYWHLKGNGDPPKGFETLKAVFNKHDIPLGQHYRTNMKEDIVFFADYFPRFSHDIFRKHIFLTDSVQQEIDSLARSFGLSETTIGIHVRMTDKTPSVSMEHLSQKIYGLKIKNPAIFLATDNKEVETYFLRNHQNVIFTQKWRPHNNAKTGIHHYAFQTGNYGMAETVLKESIIDMWLLSRCEYLIYQKNSGFSTISSILKNQENKTWWW